jgi:AcrR family transcriptional regulator
LTADGRAQHTETVAAPARHGRTNQRLRTRAAIVDAAKDLILTGKEITMREVAKSALVSEATAYRYFPDLLSLLREALADVFWPQPAEAMAPVADSTDAVERIGHATEFLLRRVLAMQGAVRAMIAATITRPETTTARPAHRLGLIDYALAPLNQPPARIDPAALVQLTRDLTVIVSAETLFTLTDLCGLSADEAIASAVRIAQTLTQAAIRTALLH